MLMLNKLETFEPRPGIAYLLITCATFLWNGIVIGRGVHQEIPPLGLSFWRWFVGAVSFYHSCAELIRKRKSFGATRNSSFSWGLSKLVVP